ncbi:MAG: hypothetical protein KAI66_09130 [Lentisphaeria bacterium]|nr:hypothetical protein [Lentisphaeria bacterium]
MKTYACAFVLCVVLLGCGRDSTEYELDESSFGANTIKIIEKECGITLPAGSKGLKFHYVPPIDPIVFAKLAIPADGGKAVETWLTGLTFSGTSFPEDFADDRCKWWPSSPRSVIMSKQGFANGYYIETYLVQEKEQLILYLKYFTI